MSKRLSTDSDVPAGRIFIIDDDPEISQLLYTLLTGAGYGVERFAEGRPALEAIQSESPDRISESGFIGSSTAG